MKTIKHVATHPDNFQPGVYLHYKGGLYRALLIALSHETTDVPIHIVVYVSLTTGEVHARPYSSSVFDAWTDEVTIEGVTVPRFAFVGTQTVPEHQKNIPDAELRARFEARPARLRIREPGEG